jgi:CcmD family protein
MTPLAYVGVAYAAVWIILFGYTWRLTAMSHRIEQKLQALERDTPTG